MNEAYLESLNNHKNLEFFVGDSPEELKAQLMQIGHPYTIRAIYAQGVKHVAWVDLSRRVNKVTGGEMFEASPTDRLTDAVKPKKTRKKRNK